MGRCENSSGDWLEGYLHQAPFHASAMQNETVYNIDLNVQFEHLQRIDVPSVVAATKEKWANRTLTRVNDSVVRLGMLEGEFHWHKHDQEDEFFFVLEGLLLIDLEDRTIELGPQQGITISKGVLHRTRAPRKVVVLMVETSEIRPTGD